MRVLVIEDEQKVARALREGLEGEHYQVEVSATGEDGFFRAVSQSFDVIILDLMLPGRSGLEILNTLRRQGHRTPVLVLTAKDAIQDRVVGLGRAPGEDASTANGDELGSDRPWIRT